MAEFKGIFTALVTPFKDGKVDEQAFQDFVAWQVEQGVHGIVPCGTTGESPTLSHEEHMRIVELAVEVAKGKATVMAGTGSNSTAEAVALTKHAKQAGADGALVVAPYYNKPTQEGIYQHYKTVQEAADIPIFIYNIPGRSIINIKDETLARLSKLPNIAGIKDATGDLTRPYLLRMAGGEKLIQFTGEDMTAVAFNAAGGVGCISVASNIMPKETAAIQEACMRGDYKEAAERHERLASLCDVLFAETSPAPAKYALSLMGKCTDELRLPLVPPSDALKKNLHQTVKQLGLI